MSLKTNKVFVIDVLRNVFLKVSLLVVMVSLCVGVPIVNAEGVVLSWTSPTTEYLFGVFMVSSSDGWAVGSLGTIIRWNGTDWSIWQSPSPRWPWLWSWLFSVFMVSADDGWAVGETGAIIQWTGTKWIPEFPAAILTPLLISLTLVAVILAKTASKKPRKSSLLSKTQCAR